MLTREKIAHASRHNYGVGLKGRVNTTTSCVDKEPIRALG